MIIYANNGVTIEREGNKCVLKVNGEFKYKMVAENEFPNESVKRTMIRHYERKKKEKENVV